MQHITITKQIFNGVELNSINARSLHKSLEVKKAFTTWIITALESMGAVEGEDYSRLKVSLEVSGYKWDYIVTADLAKHIAMMSKMPKAKEIRQYFIDVEKQVSKQIVIPQNPMEALELFFDVAKQHEEKLTDHTKRLIDIEQNSRLDTHQERRLIDAKNKKVYEIAKDDSAFATKLHRKVWQLFKKKFNLSRYNELKNGKLDDGIDYISNLTFADMVA